MTILLSLKGYDETWIRRRIETAQSTRVLHRKLKEQGFTMLEIRDELRKTYADHPVLYDLAREREYIHPSLFATAGIRVISGNAIHCAL